MNWINNRPENWLALVYPKVSTEIYSKGEVELARMFIEVGGDAMLEALKEEALVYVDKLAESSTVLHTTPRQGWLVFIPDIQDKK